MNKRRYLVAGHRYISKFASLLRRPEWQYNERDLTAEVVEQCCRTRPQLIWIEWAKEFGRKSLEAIRLAAPEAVLVSFQQDNPWGKRDGDRWQWKTYLANLQQYDLHVVKRESDLRHLAELGAPNARLWRHGVYPPLFFAPSQESDRDLPLVFVGTCMDQRGLFVEQLLEAGLPVRVYGGHWRQRTDLPHRFPDCFAEPVEGDQYANVLRRAQIAIGLVSSSNEDDWTMRSYEIPACGALLLGQRTATHQDMYEEGVEAVFFDDVGECVAQARRLLADRSARCRIASAGHQRCLESGTLADRMAQLLAELPSRVST